MKNNKLYLIIPLLFLAACVPGNTQYIDHPADFFSGIWHGLTLGITFIWSLFNDSVKIYELNNNGSWYDFGYLIGISALFGEGFYISTGSNSNKEE